MKRRAFVRSTLAAAVGASFPVVPHFTPVHRLAQQLPDVDAITGDGREINLSGKAIAEFARRLKGRVLLANDAGYDEARRVLNPSFDKHPALIAQVTGTADVRLAVDFAREHNLLTAVKCGGHSASGKSTCDKGLIIDLSPFRSVTVDPLARRAWVTGGSLLGQLDHESMAYDLVTPMGTVSHTGVGGLVTGGGFGRVARRFGLSVDNLMGVHVVAADGQFYRANAEENPDLFWGVRGGGGNFGVVTSFEFQLHPMQRQVYGGQILYPVDRARDVLEVYAEYFPRSPNELDWGFVIARPPGGGPGVAGFQICYSGPPNQVERTLAPMRALGTPIVDAAPMDYVALQKSGDIDDFRARASYLKSGFVREFPSGLIDAIVDNLEGDPDRSTFVAVQSGAGAIGEVSNDATAFSYRDAMANLLNGVDWAFGTDPSKHIAWIRAFWPHLEPFTQGFYNNDGDPEATAADYNANYRGNYPRLVEVKNKYDPTNLFRLNANITPRA